MDEPTALIEQEVRDLVKSKGIDPAKDGTASVQLLVDSVMDRYEDSRSISNLPRITDRTSLRKAVLDRVAGYGPLQALLDDPTVEEIWINAPGLVFCSKEGRHLLTNTVLGDDEVRNLVERMLRTSGRRLDLSSPFVDATLPDGSRLHVVIPDITARHWAINIRKFVLRANRLDELVRLASLTEQAAAFLAASVRSGLNILVSGGTQSGKTTMLNCLAGAIPPAERVITCEEVFELQVMLPDVVAMQTRQTNLEGRGEIDLRRLVIEALRMRPDRIIVGEVRQREALDLLVALNSGLPGMTSIHANTAKEALTKLSTLPLLAGENVNHSFVVPSVASCVDLIVHLERAHGHRRVEEILGVTGRTESTTIETVALWQRVTGELKWTGLYPPGRRRFASAGIALEELLR